MMRKKESFREERRRLDEESVARQEEIKKANIDYEYQKRASEYVLKEDLMKKKEKERRETMRQNIVTSFNMVGKGLVNLISGGYMFNVAFMATMLFGSYQVTKLAAASVMARFGRPSLVR